MNNDHYCPELAVILTVRMGSSRLPGKALVDIGGKPLLYWITERLRPLSPVIVATTDCPEDDRVVDFCNCHSIPCYRGAVDDVISRMDDALKHYYPAAKYVLRGLGDCPLTSPNLTRRMIEVMKRFGADAFVWHTMPYALPLYGSRETPYSRVAWDRIVRESKTREHIDNHFQEHRNQFKIVYHDPPPNVYFRNYRVEIDWSEDVEMFRQIATHGPGMLAPTPDIVRWLDCHPEVVALNNGHVEKTGPNVSFTYHQQRQWVKLMTGKSIVLWDDQVWNPPSKEAQPIMCNTGSCFLGFADASVLHTRDARVAVGSVDCDCGLQLIWNPRKKKSNC